MVEKFYFLENVFIIQKPKTWYNIITEYSVINTSRSVEFISILFNIIENIFFFFTVKTLMISCFKTKDVFHV